MKSGAKHIGMWSSKCKGPEVKTKKKKLACSKKIRMLVWWDHGDRGWRVERNAAGHQVTWCKKPAPDQMGLIIMIAHVY